MHTPTTRKEIENEILWNNHLITISGKSIFYRQWYNAGVKSLSDILDKEGNFLSFPEFKKKYKIKTNFLCYFGLCNAIPKYWKEAFSCDLENESVTTGQCVTHPLNISFWTCQQARSFYISKTFQNPTSKARLIKVGFTDWSIEALYILPFKVTRNIRLSMFQFKINHHILYTHDKLFRAFFLCVWRKSDTRASVCRMSACSVFLEPSCLLVELL